MVKKGFQSNDIVFDGHAEDGERMVITHYMRMNVENIGNVFPAQIFNHRIVDDVSIIVPIDKLIGECRRKNKNADQQNRYKEDEGFVHRLLSNGFIRSGNFVFFHLSVTGLHDGSNRMSQYMNCLIQIKYKNCRAYGGVVTRVRRVVTTKFIALIFLNTQAAMITLLNQFIHLTVGKTN